MTELERLAEWRMAARDEQTAAMHAGVMPWQSLPVARGMSP